MTFSLLRGGTARGPVLIANAPRAFAQALCGPANKIEAGLIKGGNKLAVDLVLKTGGDPIRMRIFANPTSKRWILLSYQDADNIACLIMIGEGFEPARLRGSDISTGSMRWSCS